MMKNTKIVLDILSYSAFLLISFAVALSSWCYGAWEMWYFWPFAGIIFAASSIQGLRIILYQITVNQNDDIPCEHRMPNISAKKGVILISATLPFLLYASIRFLQAPVFMEAQRSYLLHITSVLLAACIITGFNRFQRIALTVIAVTSIFMQSVAGVIFLAPWGYNDTYILFRKNIFGYFGRAKSSYFCPDHFSGLMELGLCVSLALILAKKSRLWLRILLIPVVLGTIYGVIISKSRGGGLTLIVIAISVMLWGFYSWRPGIRWALRAATLLIAALALGTSIYFGTAYIQRFKQWHAWNNKSRSEDISLAEDIVNRFWLTSRGRMIGGALRAWKSAPVFGIGPGMHANVWFRFAATEDGDRNSKGEKWPSVTNVGFHSYEVHSDWVQLLEEYGIVGLFLMLAACITLTVLFWQRLIKLSRSRNSTDIMSQATPMAAIFAMTAIGFHSLGDFNLQIPANTWTFAAIIALGLSSTLMQSRKEH